MKKEFIVLFLLLLPIFSFAQDTEPISLTATATQTSPFVGQKFVISVSVINTDYEDISGFLLAKGASGLTMYDIEATSGTSNQWTSGEVIFPGKGGQEEIRFNAVGNEAIEAPIEIVFNYKYKDEERKITTSIDLKVREPVCGDGECEYTESSENCCEDCACSKNYECEKRGSDIKPRCYRKSKITAFLDNLWSYAFIFALLIIFIRWIWKKIGS